MASSGSSRGRGPRARGSEPQPSPPLRLAPDAAVPDPRLAGLTAADLVGHLIRRNRRASDFVDVALVLAARERRLAEIRVWQCRAAEAEARLAHVHAGGRDHREVPRDDEEEGHVAAWIRARGDVPRPISVKRTTGPAHPPTVLQAELHDEGTAVRVVGVADLTGEEGKMQAEEEGRREEVPFEVASGRKRKEPMVSSEGKGADEDDGTTSPQRQRLRKLNLRARCSNGVSDSESEADTIDETEAEDEWEDQDALAIVPSRNQAEAEDLRGDLETGTKQGVGEAGPEDEIGGEPEGVEFENPVALAVVASRHELPPNDAVKARGMQGAGGGQETEASEKSTGTARTAKEPPGKKGIIYKMVFKALKEKESKATLAKPATAAASQPSLRCWLYAPLPEESVAEEEGPDDKDAPRE